MEPASTNPYQPPRDPAAESHTQGEAKRLSPGTVLLHAAFGAGCLGYLLGSVITFAPGSGLFWFVTTAILAAAGCLVPRKAYQWAAVIVIVLSLRTAWHEHQNGVRWREKHEHLRGSAPR